MNQASLANITAPVAGFISIAVRVFGPISDIQWFERMQPIERGMIVTKAKQHDY